jgi:hypothetical protein
MAKPLKEQPDLSTCDFSVIHQSSDQVQDILGLYDRFRSYVEHEDGLINSRLTWSLTVHGFLFAMYGILAGKVADVFVELHKAPDSPRLLEDVITGLLALQIVVAAIGAVVGKLSRGAIIASHNALLHLYAISQANAALDVNPPQASVPVAIQPGAQVVTPSSSVKAAVGARLLVYHRKTATGEVVEVTGVSESTFAAAFGQQHKAGAVVRPLGAALLPKIISGGDKGTHTKDAPSYYLTLPLCVMCIWAFLFLASSALCLASWHYRGWLFAHVGK